MVTAVVFEDSLVIPTEIRNLAEFRRWVMSSDVPERGRIDYVAGQIEVSISPESFFSHGGLKSEIHGVLQCIVKQLELGYVRVDRTRVSSVASDLSAEPDVLFISHDTLSQSRVRLIPKSGAEAGEFLEVEGGPDLIVEVVSDASVTKDTQRLPTAYFQAGVSEYWLADARREPFLFRIHRRGMAEFEPVEIDDDGFQRSAVLPYRFRLDAHQDRSGYWAFDLREQPLDEVTG
jgi:Uma2 family endonuclease